MNYSTLFPNLLKGLPTIPEDAFCYNYNPRANYNKKTKTNAFIPSGKRQLLWFTKCSSQNYCILMETKHSKIIKCHFKYISFDPILTNGCGTILWVTQLGREISLNKIIYNKGKLCKHKHLSYQMTELKYMLDNYINNIPHSSLIQLKLPVMSNNMNFLLDASNLNYTTYMVCEMNTNFTHHISTFLAHFMVVVVDHKSDIYQLHCHDDKQRMVFFDTALINNEKKSAYMKDIMNIVHISHEGIEYSDDEDETINRKMTNQSLVSCLFSTVHMKWIPYKACDRKTQISSMSQIKKILEKTLRVIR